MIGAGMEVWGFQALYSLDHLGIQSNLFHGALVQVF